MYKRKHDHYVYIKATVAFIKDHSLNWMLQFRDETPN